MSCSKAGGKAGGLQPLKCTAGKLETHQGLHMRNFNTHNPESAMIGFYSQGGGTEMGDFDLQFTGVFVN